jgi:hypothetical protein
MATTYTKIIDPDNGTGTDYTSLNAWESSRQGDLVTLDTIEVAECRCTAGSADTTAVDLDGWTTGASNYIKIWTDPDDNYRHTGLYLTGNYYRIEVSSAPSAYGVFAIRENYVRIDGIQVYMNYDSIYHAGLNPGYTSGSGDIQISNCILQANNGWAQYRKGINGGGAVVSTIWNNVIYGVDDSNSSGIESQTAHQIFNNTFYDCNYGVNQSGGTGALLKNNAAIGCTDGFYGTFDAGSDYNCSDISGDAPGANSVDTTQTDAQLFVDVGNDDFHIVDTSSDLYNAGADLSAQFTTDVDGQTRSNWDIGADEYIAPGSTAVEVLSETLEATDTPEKTHTALREFGEGLSLIDSYLRSQGHLRAFSEGISVSDDIIRACSALRELSEGLTMEDSLWYELARLIERVFSETFTLSDEREVAKAIIKVVAESISVNDSQEIYILRIINLFESLSMEDAWSKVSLVARNISEVLSTSDNSYIALSLVRDISESFSLSDELASELVRLIEAVISEVLSLSEGLSKVHVAKISVSESIGIVDSLNKMRGYFREITESLNFLDSPDKTAEYARTFTEDFALSDDVWYDLVQLIEAILSEGISVTDANERTQSFVAELAEALSLYDDLSKASTYITQIIDTLTVNDYTDVARILLKELIEFVNVTDSVLSRGNFQRIFTEQLGVYDEVTGDIILNLITAYLTETLSVSDSSAVYEEIVRLISEEVAVSDAVARTTFFARAISDTLNASDTRSRTSNLIREIYDSLALTDSSSETFMRLLQKILSESMGVSDSASQISALISYLTFVILALNIFNADTFTRDHTKVMAKDLYNIIVDPVFDSFAQDKFSVLPKDVYTVVVEAK